MDFAWAVGAVVEACGDAVESAASFMKDTAGAIKHHFDNAITMIPHFTFGTGDREKFTQHCVAFHKVSVKTTDTLFYGVCHKEGGACIRQGYRNASSMVSYVRESETTMTEVTKYSTLQRVEVHGTRRQLVKVKKQITQIKTVKIEFFETDKKMHAIRRATETSGADKMITAHVSMKVTKVQTKVITAKLRALHTHARDHAGVMQFSLSKCIKTGELKIMGTFADMEAGVETLGMACTHFGMDILHTLEMHGPQTELAKVKGILGSTAAAAVSAVKAEEKAAEAAVFSAYNWLKNSLLSVEKKAEEKLYEAKAVCEAVEKAAYDTVTDDVIAARNKVCETIESMEKQAEEMAQTAYQNAMKAEKMVEDEVKDLAKQSYKSAMEAYSEVRQAADEAARKEYERAIKAEMSIEEAVEAAHKAADKAASAAKEEMIDAAEAAASELAAAEAGIAAAEKKELEQAVVTTKAAADFCGKAVEATASTVSKEARALMLKLHSSFQPKTTEVVMVKYKKEVTTTTTEERIEIVNGRARAAAWSVTVTREQTYYITYEKHIIERSSPEEALKAAQKAADDAVKSVLGVWKKAETAASDAWGSAKDMVKKDEKAVIGMWNKGTSYALDEVTAVRNSMYAGVRVAEEEVDEAVEDVAWAVNTVVEDVSDAIDAAHNSLAGRIKSWYDALKAAEVKGLRVIADAADNRADAVERKQKVCC
uniref:Uncharacterized protein n=1 Tax=Alexandrium andersonii TaxID=327968 RepID=A0A7S2FJ12_9DINO